MTSALVDPRSGNSPNTAFSQVSPFLQLAWDSVSLGALKQCPRYYQYVIVEGWQPKLKSVHLDFGIWLHEGRERYYHARATGHDHNAAVLVALRHVLTATWNGTLQRPWTSDDPNKNRFTLVRSLVWYLDHWENDPMETVILANGKPAVELSFRLETEVESTDGERFLLAGHLDRLARLGDHIYISDLKSTKHTLDQNYFAGFSPDNQMSLYPLAVSIVYELPIQGMILDAVQVAVSFSRFMRNPIPRSEAQLDEWYQSFALYMRSAELYASKRFWPQNDKACFRCDFRSICSKPPSARDLWLKADFVKRVWNPLVSRGDV